MKIAVFLPGWIGDAVMATPAIRALHDHLQPEKMVAVSKAYVAPILDGNPWFNETILTGGKKGLSTWQAAMALRKHSIDLAVVFPNSFRSALIAWLGNCKRVIGYNRYFRGFFLSDSLPPIKDGKGKLLPTPIIDSYNLLATTAGCSQPNHKMELFVSDAEDQLAKQVWNNTGFQELSEVICLNPGAAFGASKLWPAEHFASLARDLVRLRGAGILLLCGPKESELALRITQLASHPLVRCLAEAGMPSLSLGLTKACVKRSSLLVTTDSGPRHFAAAFNRPVVSLFGPTHIEWTDTFHPLEIQLQKKLPCGPCQKRTCPIDHRCMKQLEPQEVLAASMKLLDSQLPSLRIARNAS